MQRFNNKYVQTYEKKNYFLTLFRSNHFFQGIRLFNNNEIRKTIDFAKNLFSKKNMLYFQI